MLRHPERATVVLPSRWQYGTSVAALVLMAAVLAVPLLDDRAHGPDGYHDLIIGIVGVWAFLAVISVAAALRGLPRVELTPDAIELHDVFGICVYPWDTLQADDPAEIESGPPRKRLLLHLARPDLVVREGVMTRAQPVRSIVGRQSGSAGRRHPVRRPS